jgi:hypothetical protein
MVERTFHIAIDKLRMMAVRDHLRFSEIATLAIRTYL